MRVKVCLNCKREYTDLSRNRCDCGGPLLYKEKEPEPVEAASKSSVPLSLSKVTAQAQSLILRSPRLKARVEEETLTLEKPPSIGGVPRINWLTVLVTPAITIGLMVILVIVMGMSPVMLIMSGVMSVVSAAIAVITYFRQKSRHRKAQEKIMATYRQYLDGKAQEIRDKQTRQRNALLRANNSPEECAIHVSRKDSCIWERRAGDEDFMSIRLGLGEIPAAVKAEFKRPEVVVEENELEADAEKLANSSRTVDWAPILCRFQRYQSLGIVGPRASGIQLVQNMIVEAATAHAYTDLKIVVLFPKAELSSWAWVRWLPHCWDADHKHRTVFTSLEDARESLDAIEEILMSRKNADGKDPGSDPAERLPHYLFVVAARPWIELHSIAKQLLSKTQNGCSCIFLYDRLTSLPTECEQIVELKGKNGVLYKRVDSANKTPFTLDPFSTVEADSFARAMAPLWLRETAGSASLPTNVSFLSGYGVNVPEQLHIEERWRKANTSKSLSVPIAVLPGGGVFQFDIHEKKYGVNGIVAGMPGSGKTEMVQSWILSLAVNFPPQDVSFVLIDFKGTGLIAPFKTLPHLAGSISNLDENIDRNLTALRSEIHRRETILDKYSGFNIKNVNDLNNSYGQGIVPEKLPILIVVIDEFAEFKKNFPDFGAEIDSLTSKGRALGIFVVLMTQKPAGVVSSKSEDNIKFRWCLRVANAAASREMLGTSDAARITNPGRVYIKVGEDEVYEQVQAFWSGAPYRPQQGKETGQGCISRVELDGRRIPCERVEKSAGPEIREAEIDAVVRYIRDFCDQEGIANAERVWMDRLPERVLLTSLIDAPFDGRSWPRTPSSAAVIGLLDDPANLRQEPLVLDFAKSGHTLIYGAPVSGKTTLLQTVVMSLAMTRSPEQVNIYIMDFGGWSMGILRELPHVGGIANDNEPERLKKLMLLLEDLLRERKGLFSQAGVGNISAYRSVTGETIPDVFLIVDNFGTAVKAAPEMEPFFVTLTASGANYGLYLVGTATSVTSVPMKISSNIKNSLALQLIEKSDYISVVGRISGKIPAIMGRGFVKGTPPLEFQAALPAAGDDDKTVSYNTRIMAKTMKSQWNGRLPAPIPEMPELIPYGSVQTGMPALGLSLDKVKPVCYNFKKQHFLLISGTGQSGKSSLLQVVARQLAERIGGELIVFDILRKNLPELRRLAAAYLSDPGEIDAFIERLRPELQRRQQEKYSFPDIVFKPLILVIDDYGPFFSAVSNDTISRLNAIARIGAGLDLYLFVAGDSYELTSMYNKGEAVTAALAKGKQAVMLGGCMNDHGSIQTKASYAQKAVLCGPHEGVFVDNLDFTPFKAMMIIA